MSETSRPHTKPEEPQLKATEAGGADADNAVESMTPEFTEDGDKDATEDEHVALTDVKEEDYDDDDDDDDDDDGDDDGDYDDDDDDGPQPPRFSKRALVDYNSSGITKPLKPVKPIKPIESIEPIEPEKK